MQAFTNAASSHPFVPDRPTLPDVTAAISAGDKLVRSGEIVKAELAYWAGFDERNFCKSAAEFIVPRTENRIDYGDRDDRVATSDLLIALGDLYIRQNMFAESAACYAKAKRFDSSYTYAWEQHMRAEIMAEERGAPLTQDDETAAWAALARTAAQLKIEKLILPDIARAEKIPDLAAMIEPNDAELVPEHDIAAFDLPYIPPVAPPAPAYAAA